MKFKRQLSPKLTASGAVPDKSFVKRERRRIYLIAAAILAVFVVHFAWQFSFVQKENLRIAEDSMNDAQLNAPVADVPPIEETVEIKTDSAPKKPIIEEPAKSVLPAKYAPPPVKTPSPEMNKKAVRDLRSERLRRAEKLLTGF